jgi:hypothetical protein
LVYSAPHGSIRSMRQLMTNLEEFIQDLDFRRPHPQSPSRYELRIIIQAIIFY